MATYKIINTAEMTVSGRTLKGKHGAASKSASDAYEVSLSGTWEEKVGTIAPDTGTDTVVTLWDGRATDGADKPTSFANFFLWVDIDDLWIQLIGASDYVALQLKKQQPFTLSSDNMALPAISTTPLADDPTSDNIVTICLYNPSGNTETANYSAHIAL